MTPPRNGPMSGPISAGIVTKFIAMSISERGNVLTSAVRPTGVIMAPPIPWAIRATTSSGTFGARPQASEPNMNSSIASANTRLVPKRSAIHPLIGMKTARHNV